MANETTLVKALPAGGYADCDALGCPAGAAFLVGASELCEAHGAERHARTIEALIEAHRRLNVRPAGPAGPSLAALFSPW